MAGSVGDITDAATSSRTANKAALPRLLRTMTAVAAAGLTLASCSESSVPAAHALPADQMVFTVMSAGGLVPPVLYALESPALVVYGDGRVVTESRNSAPQMVPARYEVAQVSPSTVENFVASVEASGAVETGTDFGKPLVTDLPSTMVTVHGEHGESRVGVYAFDPQFDNGLSPSQRDARARLRQVLDQADALAAGIPRLPYTPGRVVVYELDASRPGDPATVGWPGPPPSTFLTPSAKRRAIACGELTADSADVVYTAALTNPGARWLVDGVTRVLAVNPLPLTDGCP